MTGDRRACKCDHGFPLCACHEAAYAWEELLRRSRWLSSLAGWPSGRLDPEFVAGHAQAIEQARAAAEIRDGWRLEAERCPHRVIPECGCQGMQCGEGGRHAGALVTLDDCARCLQTHGPV